MFFFHIFYYCLSLFWTVFGMYTLYSATEARRWPTTTMTCCSEMSLFSHRCGQRQDTYPTWLIIPRWSQSTGQLSSRSDRCHEAVTESDMACGIQLNWGSLLWTGSGSAFSIHPRPKISPPRTCYPKTLELGHTQFYVDVWLSWCLWRSRTGWAMMRTLTFHLDMGIFCIQMDFIWIFAPLRHIVLPRPGRLWFSNQWNY